MKNILKISLGLLLVAGISITFTSCVKNLVALNLSKEYANIDMIISAPQAAGTFTINKDVTTDLATMASANGFDINKIESATINSVTLKIKDTHIPPVTTSIVTAASAMISADGLSSTEIGSDDATHVAADQIDFDLKGVDIAQYIKKDKFNVKVQLTTNAPIDHDVPVNVSMNISFKVKPLK